MSASRREHIPELAMYLFNLISSDFKDFGVFGESFLTIGFLFWERFAIAGFGVDAVFFLSPPDFPEVPRLLFEVLIV
jgi:hypothetical protein